eukprot:269541_1
MLSRSRLLLSASRQVYYNKIGYISQRCQFDPLTDIESFGLFSSPVIPDSCKQNPITQHELSAEARTGDVILWSGQGFASECIRYATQSAFSHASLLIRGTIQRDGNVYGEQDKVSVFQATASNLKEMVNNELKDAGKYKVQLTPLDLNIKENYAEREHGVYVKLDINENIRKEIEEEIKKFASETIGDDYDHTKWFAIHIADILREAIFKKMKIHRDKYVCSDLVASAYQKAGILSKNPKSMTYVPGSFCDEQSLDVWMYKAKIIPLVNRHLHQGALQNGKFIKS